jgi:hypothetical protein
LQATFDRLTAAQRSLTCSRAEIKLVMLAGGQVPLAKETAMSNRCARILAAGGAAVLVAALGVPAALAATAWTIQPGGGVQAMSSGPFLFTDSKTGTVTECISSTASGTLKSGSGLPGAHVGALSAVSFANCLGPGVPAVLIHVPLQAAGLPWHVNFSSYNAAKGVARGTISHIRILGSSNGCSFVIDGTSAAVSDGTVTFRYTDSTGRLRVLTTGGNLHVYDVSEGCLGLWNDGDTATLSTTYAVSPKQAITSP